MNSEFKGTQAMGYSVAVNHYGFFIAHGPALNDRVAAIFRNTVYSKANARLISAAPELLESLQAVIAISDRDTDVFNAEKAAIAKALGNEVSHE